MRQRSHLSARIGRSNGSDAVLYVDSPNFRGSWMDAGECPGSLRSGNSLADSGEQTARQVCDTTLCRAPSEGIDSALEIFSGRLLRLKRAKDILLGDGVASSSTMIGCPSANRRASSSIQVH